MPTGTFLTDEQRAEIIRLYTVDKLNCTEIATKTGHHRSTVFATLHKGGIDTSEKRRRKGTTRPHSVVRNRPNQPEIDAHIRESYPEHGPAPTAERFGITAKVVSKMAWKLGVRCTTGIARKNKTVADRNDSCDQSFFENWSPNLAWLLGYTWADGAIRFQKACNHIHYRCAVQDEHIIHDIRSVIKSTSKLQRFDPKPLKGGKYIGQAQVGFSIDSINVARIFVERFGIPPNKSNIDPPFPNVPDEWLNHFLRGAVDGDGSIFYKQGRPTVVLVGSHRYTEELSKRVSRIVGIKEAMRTKGTSDKICVITWHRKYDIARLIPWMYPQGSYLELARKAKTARDYLASPSHAGITPDIDFSPEGHEQ